MSGIVGIVNRPGTPVDPRLLRRMTDFLAYRGPDGQSIWVDGSVGLGHAMLRTTTESARENQPCSLDGDVWITADARVDGRKDLIQKLKALGRIDVEAATDVELLLHAYHAWGEACVEHVIGDFAFAIWDGRRRRLFCARDHFGIKPFYYARLEGCLIFSNTLSCIREHPAISDELNDLAIADFLLFDFNQDMATTTFADIQRLPPAHDLIWSEGTPRLSRYWTLPIADPIQYKRRSDYVEHFRELLSMAVDDRLRADRIGVWMSGGLDSPSVAATARELLSNQSKPYDLRAYTIVYDRLLPGDEERYYSGLVAEALGIPIHYQVANDYTLYERWDQPELRTPEPVHEPLAAIIGDQFRQVAARSQVLLTGHSGDIVFYFQLQSHVARLLKDLQFGRLIADVGRYILLLHRLPRLAFRTRLNHLLGRDHQQPAYPTWLNQAFATWLDLPARMEQLNSEAAPIHPIHPMAYESLLKPFWPHMFEGYDPGVTRLPVEVRHPFFDLRLVDYLLAVPPVPWCVNKELLRVAMYGTLPELVRLRPKAPLAGDPVLARLRHHGAQCVNHFDPAPELAKYVNRNAILQVTGEEDPDELFMNMRPLSLNYWFKYLAQVKCKPERRDKNDYQITYH